MSSKTIELSPRERRVVEAALMVYIVRLDKMLLRGTNSPQANSMFEAATNVFSKVRNVV